MTVHRVDLEFSQFPRFLEQKNSDQFPSRSFPLKVAYDSYATIRTQGCVHCDFKSDRGAPTFTTPGRTDSSDLWEKASEIV